MHSLGSGDLLGSTWNNHCNVTWMFVTLNSSHTLYQNGQQNIHYSWETDHKRKPLCIGGMELVSLSCNRVFISAESVGRGWCKIAIATKSLRFQLWQLSVTYTQYDMPPHPTPSKNCARYFTSSIGMATLWSACTAVCRVNKWFTDDVLRSVKGAFLSKSYLSC